MLNKVFFLKFHAKVQETALGLLINANIRSLYDSSKLVFNIIQNLKY